MTATAKLNLELLANSAANQTLANTTFAQLNQLVQAAVVDKDLSAPPGSPANEALYIVAGSPTGAWAGKAGQLAYWLTSTNLWQFIVPREGFLVHVNDEDVFYKYDGAAWAIFSSGGGSGVDVEDTGTPVAPASTLNFIGAIVTDQGGGVVDVEIPGGGFTGGTLTSAINEAPIVTLASAATVNIGAAAANTISISGTTTVTAFDTIASGAIRRLVFQGALTLTHNGTSLILPTGANIVTAAGDVTEFVSLGSGNWRCTGYEKSSGESALLGPLVSAHQSATQSIPNGTVFTKVTLNAEGFDSNGFFNTGTSRLQPTLAGWYLVSAGLLFKAVPGGDAGKLIVLAVHKNGTRVNNLAAGALSSGTESGMTGSCLVYLNGTTDYLEMFAAQGAAGALGTEPGSQTTYLQAYFLRS